MPALSRRWTLEYNEKLKLMAENGDSAMKCAAALKRRVDSVKKQARTLGVEVRGVRAMRNNSREKIGEAERDLPAGAQRFDGFFVR